MTRGIHMAVMPLYATPKQDGIESQKKIGQIGAVRTELKPKGVQCIGQGFTTTFNTCTAQDRTKCNSELRWRVKRAYMGRVPTVGHTLT